MKAQHQGNIVRFEYETYDYTRKNKTKIIKPAYVYLPYGYNDKDTTTRYNILYLMHGWTMTASDFFYDGSSHLSNLLDNMIENGDIQPLIVVCATFDAENQSQGFPRSVSEIAVFHNDFRNDLIVAVEKHFHTYAKGTTEAELQASRLHRAFAGFSLGAVTTWYQFVYNIDFIKYFIPMSGDCWILGTYGGMYHPVETTRYLENVVQSNGFENDFFVYSFIGTSDAIWNQSDTQMRAMIKSHIFTPRTFKHGIKLNGRHTIPSCEEYLYNALKMFFS
ncbi:putative esterase [Histomonas meleagridis]|uniref:putative esterase n=1 Tax=Histomonas meleagridis TaxID=135588 RepID=UPI00355A0060|nr:putative esterase [Histomonas meleagridis]KAH0796368.1 putative esterase [Histomonas meleagridis]